MVTPVLSHLVTRRAGTEVLELFPRPHGHSMVCEPLEVMSRRSDLHV